MQSNVLGTFETWTSTAQKHRLQLHKNIICSFQPKVAERGSGQISIKDIDKLDILTKQINDLRKVTGSEEKSKNYSPAIGQLTQNIEKLGKHTMEIDNKDKDGEK